MKKIAIALVATATLALAACGGEKAATNVANVTDTLNEAVSEVENAGEAVENAAANATDAAQNVVDAATDQAANAAEATK